MSDGSLEDCFFDLCVCVCVCVYEKPNPTTSNSFFENEKFGKRSLGKHVSMCTDDVKKKLM